MLHQPAQLAQQLGLRPIGVQQRQREYVISSRLTNAVTTKFATVTARACPGDMYPALLQRNIHAPGDISVLIFRRNISQQEARNYNQSVTDGTTPAELQAVVDDNCVGHVRNNITVDSHVHDTALQMRQLIQSGVFVVFQPSFYAPSGGAIAQGRFHVFGEPGDIEDIEVIRHHLEEAGVGAREMDEDLVVPIPAALAAMPAEDQPQQQAEQQRDEAEGHIAAEDALQLDLE